METVRAYLGLGGNIGDPEEAMRSALQAIDADPSSEVALVSSLYNTPPWGKIDQPDFLNAVAEIETSLTPKQLLEFGLDVEQRLKRVRDVRWGPRSIDIDILWYDSRRIVEEGLHIPHPRMLERAFVLVPLAEIAPNLVIDGQTLSERAQSIDRDGIQVSRPGSSWWRLPRYQQ